MPDVFLEPHHAHHEKKSAPPNPFEKNTHRSIFSHKLGFFSTFVRDPFGVVLAEQHKDEHILVFIRRAFISNSGWIATTILLLFIPILLHFFLVPLSVMSELLGLGAVFIFTLFYYIVVVGFALGNFLTWFYDIGIVTEKRAVDIDFYNISFVSVATARAQDLKDVRYVQKGFFESFFDYGDVTLVVEASGEILTFEKTPRPAEVVSILSALIGGHQ